MKSLFLDLIRALIFVALFAGPAAVLMYFKG